MLRKFKVLIICFFLYSCYNNEFKYNFELADDIYLAESDILPSRFIYSEKTNGYLILLDNVYSIIGNRHEALIVTKEKREKYFYVNFDKVEYPEDIYEISSKKYLFLKKKVRVIYDLNIQDGSDL